MKTDFNWFGSSVKIGRLVVTLVSFCLLTIVSASTRAQTLGDALNATNLTWSTSTTGGATPWFGETSISHDRVSAAACTVNNSSQTSTLQTTVTGPGTLTFWWYNAGNASTLTLTANSVTQAGIGFSSPWQQQTIYLGTGTQTLKWINSGIPGGGTVYLDQVSYTQGATAPIINTQPLNQSQIAGFNTLFTVNAAGTPVLTYQWQFNGTNIPSSTNSSLAVSNVQAINLGNYTVIVTNSFGALTSSVAQLGFGRATGWGYNSFGETSIAYGATNSATVSAALHGGAVLDANDGVLAWSTDATGYALVPDDLTNVIALASGSAHAVALKSDGTVTAWGYNGDGETNVPAGLSNVVMIACGNQHSLALKSDGTVVAWGQNIFGQTNVPAVLSNVVAVSAGLTHSLALKADGTVAGWGSNSSGQATPPSGLSNVVAIAAGMASIHSLALTATGNVVGWGYNGHGQTSAPLNLTNAVAISAGGNHSLALRADGTVVGWGWNNYGQTNTPVGLTNVVAISAGFFHNLAVVGDGLPITTATTSNLSLSNTDFSLSLPSQNGRVYALEYKNSLTDSNWMALPLVAGNGTNLVLFDPAATNSQRIYRVRRW